MVRSPLPLSARLAYALPAAPLAALQVSLTIFLPKFYTDVVHVQVGLVSWALLSVRMFDALTDPLIGWLSDRTRSAWGRRRPWILGSSLPLVFAFYLLFNPSPALSAHYAQVWLWVGVFTVYLFWTAVAIPYESLGAELSFDYDERTAILGLRDAFLLAGTLLAAGFPALVTHLEQLGTGPQFEQRKFLLMSLAFGGLALILCSACVAVVREPRGHRVSTSVPSWSVLREMMANEPFRILLLAYTVSAVGSNLPGTMLLYHCQYVMQSDRGEWLLLLYVAAAMVSLPAWIRLAQRFGKKQAWLASMVVNLGTFAWAYPLGPEQFGLFTFVMAISGTGGGAAIALPHAMQPDVIDYDEWRSGQRREGQYIGIWTLAKKLAAALGVGAALVALDQVGYVPNMEQNAKVKATIRVFFIAVPVVCYAVAFAIAWRYPLDRERHARIRREIDQRGT